MKRDSFCVIAFLTANALAVADYVRAPGKSLRELAQARGFHVGANFPNLYAKWKEGGTSGPG